jgi:hypothetical protein
VQALAIQHSEKSGEMVLDICCPQISTGVLLSEHSPLYPFTRRGYQRTMRKVREAFHSYASLREKASIKQVLYIK